MLVMKKSVVKIFVYLILITNSKSVGAQFYNAALSKYEEQFTKEKIHIQFDKANYSLNETIFYKLYLLEGNDLSTLSKNVFVSWYDTSGKFLKQTVAPLIMSSSKGSYDIPTDYKGEFLHVKAFTRWMLNDDSIFLYEKDIRINPLTISKRKERVARTIVEIFPEGGELVSGIETRLAFKAVNEFGIPVNIKGVLQNSKKEVLDSVNVLHDGMGYFHLKANSGEPYQIKWLDEFLKIDSTQITQAKNEGVSLNVSLGYKKANVQVERTKNVPENLKQLKLLVHQNQHLLYSVDFNGSQTLQQKIGLRIDTFPTGIVQFSLFDNNWIPVAERIVFINNQLPTFDVKISSVLSNLNKRGKNTLELELLDSVEANMSISITDAISVLPEQFNIYSDFLLSNEIKGSIHNPAYYFSSDADSVADHLDLVMLTNGWRKFDWNKLKSGDFPVLKYPRETNYMGLSGEITKIQKSKLPKNLLLNIALQAKDSSKQFLFIPVSPTGKFENKTVFFFDTSSLYYSFNDHVSLRSNSEIHFNNGLLMPDKSKIQLQSYGKDGMFAHSSSFELLDNYLQKQAFLRKEMESTTLKEVVVHSIIKTRLQQLDEDYATGFFKGGIGDFHDVQAEWKSMQYIDVISYLKSIVPLSMQNSATQLYLDDVKANNGELDALPVSLIAYVKIFKPPFFGLSPTPGGVFSNGAVAVYTRRAGSSVSALDQKSLMEKTVLSGYSVFKEFYHPNYETAPTDFKIDNRSTLYWNPYLITNSSNKKISIDFYNNDTSNKLQIVLEGVNANGKLTRVVKYLE
jgi:hypothetical protein